MTYAQHVSTKKTAQSQKVFGKKQVKNNAGGYVFGVDDFKRLERFLILGCEGGTYYCGEKPLTIQNAKCVLRCASQDVDKTISIIRDFVVNNRVPKKDPAIFALSLLMIDYPRQAGAILNEVCRTGTQLFQFVENCNKLRGWGRTLKETISNWYTDKTVDQLAYQVTKYQQRNGWSHRDVLRLAHPKSETHNEIFQYICQKDKWQQRSESERLHYLDIVEEAKSADPDKLVRLIREHGLVREHIPTTHLNNTKVWEALLEKMPMTALLRNLGNLSKNGLILPFSDSASHVVGQLTDQDVVSRSGIHPYSVLLAIKNYGAGHGWRGDNSWTVNQQVLDALEDCYLLAFKNAEPVNKRFYLGVDVSGSMTCQIQNSNISCREAAAAMAHVTVQNEPMTYTAAFTGQLVDLKITKKSSLHDILNKTSNLRFGRTNCALPMIDALNKKLNIDCFVVYTDNETWYGDIHPFQALNQYRQKMGINAKLIVCGMTATQFSIADPSDPGMLDVVGFDASVPQVMSEFLTN